MAGRRPLPSALKALRGNPGKRALPRNEPKPEVKIPPRPEWLSQEAKREWSRLAPGLRDLGLLTFLDRAPLAIYCQAYADLKEARQRLAEEGQIVVNPTESGPQRVPNPWVKIYRDALAVVAKFGGEFGATPASRARVHAAEPEDDDDPILGLIQGAQRHA